MNAGRLDSAEWRSEERGAMRFRLVVAGEANDNGDAAGGKGKGRGTKK